MPGSAFVLTEDTEAADGVHHAQGELFEFIKGVCKCCPEDAWQIVRVVVA